MSAVTATISARFTIAGLHHWPHAHPERAYLATPHRHLFHITVTVNVHHDDRAIEYHDLADIAAGEARQLGEPAGGLLVDFGDRSCEALARQLCDRLVGRFGPGVVESIVWSEDGEFWSTITRKD